MDLIIDAELHSYLPPVAGDDLERELVEAGGPRDTIKVWRGRGIILDGHRRHAVCVKHNLPFKIEEIEVADRRDAMRWMLHWQLDRRNLTAHDAALLRSRLADLCKASGVKAPQEEAANRSGVTARTVRRAKQYATAFESLPKRIADRIASGDLDASQKDVIELANLPPETIPQVVKEVDSGEARSLHDALFGEPIEGEDEDEAPEPAVPAPAREQRPAADQFATVVKSFGVLKRELDRLGREHPAAYYTRIMRTLEDVDELLDAWEKEIT